MLIGSLTERVLLSNARKHGTVSAKLSASADVDPPPLTAPITSERGFLGAALLKKICSAANHHKSTSPHSAFPILFTVSCLKKGNSVSARFLLVPRVG